MGHLSCAGQRRCAAHTSKRRSLMSDVHHIGRGPVLAGIGAAALAAFFDPPLVRAQALDRPPRVLIFDVAESLLDLLALRPLFQRISGNGAMVNEWFGETILYSESATLINTFVPFGQLGAGALRYLS
jgi:hypothetical protein